MEITPNIHLVDGIRGVNCYLCMAGDKLLLVDTGFPGSAKKIINYVKSLGKEPSDIEYIILTHSDIDHTGSAAELKKLTGARLAIHAADASVLTGKKRHKTIKGPLGILLNLLVRLIRFHPAVPDLILGNGIELECFKVIDTPGHTSGSISLYQPGKLIFVGDTIRGDLKGNPQPFTDNVTDDIAKAWESVAAISKLDFEIMLPGHGAPVIGNASAEVKKLLSKYN